jgi:hypothetical protein
LLVASSADASTSYVTRLSGNHGAARLTLGNPYKLYVNARGLARGTWTQTLYMGTCSRLSTRIRTLPVLIAGSTGAVGRTNTLTASQARLARSGVVRLVHGATVVCGSFATAPAIASPSPFPSPGPSPTSRPTSTATQTPGGTSSPGATSGPTGTPAGSTPTPTPVPGTTTLPWDQIGNGSAFTPTYDAPATYRIGWAFDCTKFGSPGRFKIEVIRGGTVVQTPVSTTASDGYGDAGVVGQAGSTRVHVTSDCDWEVVIANEFPT